MPHQHLWIVLESPLELV